MKVKQPPPWGMKILLQGWKYHLFNQYVEFSSRNPFSGLHGLPDVRNMRQNWALHANRVNRGRFREEVKTSICNPINVSVLPSSRRQRCPLTLSLPVKTTKQAYDGGTEKTTYLEQLSFRAWAKTKYICINTLHFFYFYILPAPLLFYIVSHYIHLLSCPTWGVNNTHALRVRV